MPPELRKRKAPTVEPAAAPPAKKKGPAAKKGAAGTPKAAQTNGIAGKIAVGTVIDLEGFGGEIETNDGKKTTLKALVEESKGGVVLFTYPKASTPGCTTQVCNFRDSYHDVTSTGFAVYGLSKDSTKANSNFKEKQNLQYPLLCDPSATLISAIGLKKEPSGTTRGVFVIDKAGKVLAAQPGSPGGTLDVVKKIVSTNPNVHESKENGADAEDQKEEAPAADAAN